MIQINDLKFRYPKGNVILDNISLTFNEGTVYGIFGGNGEGKSTLIKLLTGLLNPQSGSYQIFGKNQPPRMVDSLKDIFIVPEDFELNGHKISSYEKLNSAFYPEFSKDLFYDIIRGFDMSPDAVISSLSFGQKKKVLIAFGIAANTRMLFMDEPTNGLDIPSKSQYRKIMASAVDQGKCVVIATHQVRDLHSLIDHVIVLDGTKIVFNSSLAEVSEHLWFGRDPDAQTKAIYSEDIIGGKSIFFRKDQQESDIDIELLYHAIIHDPTSINHALKNNYHGSSV